MAELTALQSVPAGTIGSGTAQVFNPMQGVQILANARQRQDQIDWHNKQAELARQKAIADARQKAEEDEVVAKFEVAQGDHFRQPVQGLLDKEIDAVRQAWPSLNKTQRMQAVENTNQFAKQANQFISSQDSAFKAARTRLGNDYVIPATVERDLVLSKVSSDPNFYKKDFTPDFEKTITTNPAFFNWENVGQRISEKAGTMGNKTMYASGTGTDIKYSQFFTGKKDPKTGLPEINKKVAMGLIDTDPAATNMRNVFIAQQLPKLQEQFPNMKPDELLRVAEGEVINRLFRGRGVYDVTKDLQPTKTEAELKAQGEKVGDIVRAPVNITRSVSYTEGNSGLQRKMNGMIGAAEQVGIRKGQPVELSPNKTVFIIGGDPKKYSQAFTQNTDGSWQTKFGGTVRDWAKFKEPVFTLTAPTPTRVKDKGKVIDIVRPAGTVLTRDEGVRLLKAYPQNIRQEEAYILSPSKLQEIQSDDPDIANLFRNPAFKDVEIIIPANQANELAPFSKPKFSTW